MHVHISHMHTHTGSGSGWLPWSPLLFSPSVSALKHTSILTPVTPQSEHTHIQVHTLQWVRGKAELSHTSSHWQCVCRVCNSPTGELILLTSRVRNISSPLRPRGSAGTKVSLLHTHKDTPTNMLENTHTDILPRAIRSPQTCTPWQILTWLNTNRQKSWKTLKGVHQGLHDNSIILLSEEMTPRSVHSRR